MPILIKRITVQSKIAELEARIAKLEETSIDYRARIQFLERQLATFRVVTKESTEYGPHGTGWRDIWRSVDAYFDEVFRKVMPR